MENTTPHTNSSRPMGFWLRATERLIARELADAAASEGVTRREWMILNVLDGSVDAPGLAARIQRGGKHLRALEDRGWVTEADGSWAFTDEGRAAKARLGEAAEAVHAKIASAVSPDDFATTLASLEAIARTLGSDLDHDLASDENEPMPHRHRRGFGRHSRGCGHGRDSGRQHGDGHGHPDHHGHDRPDHHSHGHNRPHHHSHGHNRGDEHAYERGFDAGFARGAASHAG